MSSPTLSHIDAESATRRVLERARRYVEHETPSGDEAAIADLGDTIRADLEAIGATVEVAPAPGLGVNIVAEFPGASAELAPVVVLAHMDTVHPRGSLAARPFRVEDGKAFGPGIYDMKTGIAVAVEALTVLRERGLHPARPVRLIITCDEEIGSHSARELIVSQARQAHAVLVPEPCLPDGGVKTARKGVATYRVATRGIAAHAGIEGASAVSAIRELVLALHTIIGFANVARGTTINIGTIRGGTASNVVAADAEAMVDVRLAEPAEADRIHAAMMDIQRSDTRAGLDVTLTEDRPPLVRTPAVVKLWQHARDIAADLGTDLPEGASGGGSDGSIAGDAGAAVLDGLGAQGGGAHADDEHIVLADLPFRLHLMVRLLQTL